MSRDAQLTEALGDYRRWLYKTAGDLVGPLSNDLDDLVQEGYIAMWRALGKYDPAKGALPSWLTTAARARMKDVLRRDTWTGTPRARGHIRYQPGIPVADENLDRMVAAETVEMAYHRGDFAKALATLTPAQREAVYRKFWLDEIVPNGYWAGAVPKLIRVLSHLAECCE